MIRSYRSKALWLFFEKGDARLLPPRMVKRIETILDRLNQTKRLAAVSLPSLHPLKGKRKGEWAVRVTGNYRITFRFEGESVYDVDLEDYHR